MRPERWLCSNGSAALVTLTTPKRSASICPPEVLSRHLLDGRADGLAGVVHHHVQRPELVRGYLHRSTRCGRVGDIEGRPANLRAVAAGEVAELLRATGRRDHVVAVIGGTRSEPSPEAPRAAGDEPGPGHAYLPFSLRLVQPPSWTVRRATVLEVAQRARGA